MKAEMLFRVDGKPVDVWVCGECQVVHAKLEYAERCCAPRLCDGGCGTVLDRKTAYVPAHCAACWRRVAAEREAQRRAKAVRHTVDSVPADVPLCRNDDQFYETISDLLDGCCNGLEEDDFPIYAWLCRRHTPYLDVDVVLEHLTDTLELADGHDIESLLEDVGGLRSGIEAWNAKQTPCVYMPEEKAYVVVEWTDVQHDEDTTDGVSVKP